MYWVLNLFFIYHVTKRNVSFCFMIEGWLLKENTKSLRGGPAIWLSNIISRQWERNNTNVYCRQLCSDCPPSTNSPRLNVSGLLFPLTDFVELFGCCSPWGGLDAGMDISNGESLMIREWLLDLQSMVDAVGGSCLNSNPFSNPGKSWYPKLFELFEFLHGINVQTRTSEK